MSGITDFVLQMAGLPAPLIAQIDAATPQISALVALEEKLAPIFSTPQTMAQHVAAATPILKSAVPDIVAVLPVLKGVADFLATAKL